ncbi:hypothetical protein [Pseudonocardia endophytica]|uniref:hypothetical protein n=1 Tax=Pseudonocardia endophytica TaxID=401976 RepID=UPI0010492213|nr:hypothetical protein [Pseudonocardia endophytica]
MSNLDLDADRDGVPDTVVAVRDSGGAWVFTDTDADGFADQVIDLADDPAEPDEPDDGVLDALLRLVTGRTV